MRTPNHTSAFFFAIANDKFLRVDLDQLVCCISMNDHAQLHTATDFNTLSLMAQQTKELLKEDQFLWINDHIALSRRYANTHR